MKMQWQGTKPAKSQFSKLRDHNHTQLLNQTTYLTLKKHSAMWLLYWFVGLISRINKKMLLYVMLWAVAVSCTLSDDWVQMC